MPRESRDGAQPLNDVYFCVLTLQSNGVSVSQKYVEFNLLAMWCVIAHDVQLTQFFLQN